MKLTWTQQLVLGNMATKYLGSGWGDYENIDLKELYDNMARKGASIIEMGAMSELFMKFSGQVLLNSMYKNKTE